MARRIAERYGQHEAVIAFQIDNELCGNLPDHGPLAARAFHSWLATRHGDLKTFDERLGLIFWGQQFDDWSQIPVPTDGSFHPGLQLEFRRFSSEAWVTFCAAQATAMRPHIGERLLTTNCYLHKWGTHIDWSALVANSDIDRFSFDNYTTSDHENAFYNDLGRSLTPKHWILEQQCGLPQGQHLWPDDPDRITRALTISVERGAELLTFFRWRQGLFGHEQDHGAILDHHGRPGPIFDEVQSAVRAITAAGPAPAVEPRVAAVFTWDDDWAMATSPESLDHVAISIDRVAQAAYGAGEALTWAVAPADLVGFDVIVVAGKLIRDEAWEAALISAAEAGAVVISMPLFGAKDQWNAYLPDYQSEAVRAAQGAVLDRRINLREGSEIGTDSGATMALRSELWILDEGVDILQRFSDGPIASAPAVFTHSIGSGSWCTVAGYMDPKGLQKLLVGFLDG
jgi:beta-galactosidase